MYGDLVNDGEGRLQVKLGSSAKLGSMAKVGSTAKLRNPAKLGSSGSSLVEE